MAITPLDARAAALEQVGALDGHGLDVLAFTGIQSPQGMAGLIEWGQEGGAQLAEWLALPGLGAAFGDALQIDGGDQMFTHGLFDLRGQVERLDLGL